MKLRNCFFSGRIFLERLTSPVPDSSQLRTMPRPGEDRSNFDDNQEYGKW